VFLCPPPAIHVCPPVSEIEIGVARRNIATTITKSPFCILSGGATTTGIVEFEPLSTGFEELPK
jgi:hypothetical protein